MEGWYKSRIGAVAPPATSARAAAWVPVHSSADQRAPGVGRAVQRLCRAFVLATCLWLGPAAPAAQTNVAASAAQTNVAAPAAQTNQAAPVAPAAPATAAAPDVAAVRPAAIPAGAALTLEVPAQVRWDELDSVPVVVGTKVAAARNLSFAAGPFSESATGRVLQIHFCLSGKPGGGCLSPHSLPENSQETLWLVPEGRAQVGSYTGIVRLIAGNGLETSKPLTLNVSSSEWRERGLGALFAGVVLSFLMTVLLPHQRERDLSLRPFLLLRERLGKTENSIKPFEAKTLKKRLAEVAEELSVGMLESGGHTLPDWPSPNSQGGDAAALKAHFDALQAKVVAIELIADAVAAAPDDATRSAVDALAAAREFEKGDLTARINQALGAAQARQQRAPAKLTSAELVFREELRNMAFWVISSLIAVALGYVLLVESDAAFGGWADVVAAFLWGLGLSTAGSKLADLTVGQVRSALRPVT